MKITIAGDGKVGSTLARQLSAEGYDITLIDSNQFILAASVDQYDVMGVHGNCVSMDVLEEANIRECDLLIAATSADEINLLCCMTAHSMNPRLHTIARIRNPEYTKQLYAMRDLFALSLGVNPEKQAAQEIERLVKYPGFLKRDPFAKGRAQIVELRVDDDSKLKDRALMELPGLLNCRVLVCAVLRDGAAIAPVGSFVLREGDRIFVTASTDNLTILLHSLGIVTQKTRRVLLCGGGRISYYLAELLLKSGVEVELIERDHQRCQELAEQLPEACVVEGDATNQALLEREGIGNFDAVVSLTGMDEQNILLALLANSHRVPQVITKLGHLESSYLLNDLPLGSIVNPKELCCSTIVQYVRALQNQTGAALAVHKIADGQAEALEFTVDEHVRSRGVPLKQLRLRPNVLVAGIIHAGVVEIPNGDSCFEMGDTVVIVSNGDRIIYQLNDIFND